MAVGVTYSRSIDSLNSGPFMTIKTVTHLNFRGDARAALEFYQSVFGGDLAALTYKDAGNVQNPAEAGQIMWGQVVERKRLSHHGL